MHVKPLSKCCLFSGRIQVEVVYSNRENRFPLKLGNFVKCLHTFVQRYTLSENQNSSAKNAFSKIYIPKTPCHLTCTIMDQTATVTLTKGPFSQRSGSLLFRVWIWQPLPLTDVTAFLPATTHNQYICACMCARGLVPFLRRMSLLVYPTRIFLSVCQERMREHQKNA